MTFQQTTSLLLSMALDGQFIVDLPIENGDFPVRYVVYQRVTFHNTPSCTIQSYQDELGISGISSSCWLNITIMSL